MSVLQRHFNSSDWFCFEKPMLMFGCLILPLGAFLLTSKLKPLLKCLPPIQVLTRPALLSCWDQMRMACSRWCGHRLKYLPNKWQLSFFFQTPSHQILFCVISQDSWLQWKISLKHPPQVTFGAVPILLPIAAESINYFSPPRKICYLKETSCW